MSFELMSDEQILNALGEQYEALRIGKGIQQKQIIEEGGIGKDAINNFRYAKGDAKLSTLIKILRGLGELDRLDKLLEIQNEFSPTQAQKNTPKRIHSKPRSTFSWDDEK